MPQCHKGLIWKCYIFTNIEPSSSSGWRDLGGRSPPTPPGSVWQPAPPFQCLPALGAAPKATAPVSDTARYHSLGRPMPMTIVRYISFLIDIPKSFYFKSSYIRSYNYFKSFRFVVSLKISYNLLRLLGSKFSNIFNGLLMLFRRRNRQHLMQLEFMYRVCPDLCLWDRRGLGTWLTRPDLPWLI